MLVCIVLSSFFVSLSLCVSLSPYALFLFMPSLFSLFLFLYALLVPLSLLCLQGTANLPTVFINAGAVGPYFRFEQLLPLLVFLIFALFHTLNDKLLSSAANMCIAVYLVAVWWLLNILLLPVF